MTTNTDLNIKDSITIDQGAKLVFVTFADNMLKNMSDNDFSLYVNDSLLASTGPTGTSTSHPFVVDLKPSFDPSRAQKIDAQWDRKFGVTGVGAFAGNAELYAKGSFSTKPDSEALNSIQLKIGYTFIWANADVFKYVGFSGNIASEHPQDFSQTNLVGDIVVSTILPWTDILARIITNNTQNSSVGLLLQPAIDYVKNTMTKDLSYVRGAIHGSWDVPIMKDQYVSIYGVAYFQHGIRPRSYIEMTLAQNLSPSLAVVAQWVNGELPPLFQRDVDLRIGLRFQ
jgi:hypothetical protein